MSTQYQRLAYFIRAAFLPGRLVDQKQLDQCNCVLRISIQQVALLATGFGTCGGAVRTFLPAISHVTEGVSELHY